MSTDHIINIIGNTPLVRLNKIVPKRCAEVYVKLEYYNPTGSYKDRMASSIILEAEKRGVLKQGMTVTECTAGSTGTLLAFVCRAKGYPFKVISSDAFAKEKLQAMRLFGAELELLKSQNGKITPDLIPRMMEHVRKISEEKGYYWTRQFENPDVIEGFRPMGKEIVFGLNKPVDVFCAGVGTAGMFAGVSIELKQAYPSSKVVALEPASAPLISKGLRGSHKIEGIGVGFVPPFLEKAVYDEVRTIEEERARFMAKQLALEEGIFAGTSSGLNIAAAVDIAKEIGPGYSVVTVACDSGWRYLSGSLFD